MTRSPKDLVLEVRHCLLVSQGEDKPEAKQENRTRVLVSGFAALAFRGWDGHGVVWREWRKENVFEKRSGLAGKKGGERCRIIGGWKQRVMVKRDGSSTNALRPFWTSVLEYINQGTGGE